jgi:hypothetical protein
MSWSACSRENYAIARALEAGEMNGNIKKRKEEEEKKKKKR